MKRYCLLMALLAVTATVKAGWSQAPGTVVQSVEEQSLPPGAVQRLGSLKLRYSSLNDLQYLPDGRLLVLQGQQLEVMDMAAGEVTAQHRLPFPATSLNLKSDGHTLLLTGTKEQVGLFDLTTGQAGQQWSTGQAGLRYAQFSPDESRVLTVGRQPPALKEWELATGRELREIKSQLTYLDKAVYALDGKVAVAGGGYDTLEFWDLTTGQLLGAPRISYCIYDLEASADGTRVLAAGRSYGYEFDVAERTVLKQFGGHSGGAVTGQCYGRHADEIFTGSRDGSIRRWNRLEARVLARWFPHATHARLLRSSPDGRWVVSFSSNQFITESSTDQGEPRLPLDRHRAAVEAVAWLAGGEVLSCAGDGTARLWDPTTGQCLALLPAGLGGTCVAGSIDGQRLAVGAKDSIIYEFDLAGHELRQLKGHYGYIRALQYLPDGRLASSADDGQILLWGDEAEPQHRLLGHRGGVLALGLADEQHLASAGRDGTVRLWVLTPEPRQLWSHAAHGGFVNCLTAGVNGRFYSGGQDGQIISWQLTGEALPEPWQSGRAVSALAQSPDGNRVWAGSIAPQICGWSVSDGQPLPELTGHLTGINGLAVSPAGNRLISASADTSLLVWAP
jgi:WD40 repeat protein